MDIVGFLFFVLITSKSFYLITQDMKNVSVIYDFIMLKKNK